MDVLLQRASYYSILKTSFRQCQIIVIELPDFHKLRKDKVIMILMLSVQASGSFLHFLMDATVCVAQSFTHYASVKPGKSWINCLVAYLPDIGQKERFQTNSTEPTLTLASLMI